MNKNYHFINKYFQNIRHELLYLIPLVAGYIIALWVIAKYSWVLPEQLYMRSKLLESGKIFSLESFKACIDWRVMEFAPRYTRPMSNIFECFDTNFRAFMWFYITPSPYIKLSNIVLFIFAPFFLFNAFNKLGIHKLYSSFGIFIFLLSPGFLSHLVMDFRPGKSFVLLLSTLQVFISTFNSNIKLYCKITLFVTFVSVFFDETFLVVAIIPFFLNSEKYFNLKYILYTILTITVAVGLMLVCQYIIFSIFSIPFENPFKYAPMTKNSLYSNELIFDLFMTFFLSLNESLLFPTGGDFVVIANLIWLFLIIFLSYMIIKEIDNNIYNKKWIKTEFKITMLILMLVFYSIIHAVFMSRVDNNVWGIFYYGTYGSLAGCMIWTLCCSRFSENINNKMPIMVAMIVVGFGQLIGFLHTNEVYRDLHYYPHKPIFIMKYFKSEYDRFRWISREPIFNDEDRLQLWIKSKNNLLTAENLNSVPRSFLYIPIESSAGRYQFPIQLMWSWER